MPPAGGGTRIPLVVPSSGPLYEGHFPDRPILPGVGLLDLALRAMNAGDPPALRGVETLRLRRLVAPGEVLDLDLITRAPDGRARIEVRRAAEVVATATVLPGEPAHGTGRARRPYGAQRVSGVPGLDDLLPHRPPMRFVEGVVEQSDDGVVCAVSVPGRSAFDTGGLAPALVAIEMAAQSAAVCESLRRSREEKTGGARLGYLVGARDVVFERARVPVGETLFAAVRLSGIALPLCTYGFEITQGSEAVASGTVSTWLTTTDA